MKLLSLAGALACATLTHAQTPEEYKGAADMLMAQDALKISYASPRWTSVFITRLKDKTTQFTGANDRFCFGNAVPTKVTYVDQELVFGFETGRGCPAPQYRFNPITGAGKIYTWPDGGATWTEITTGKVALVK